MRDHLLHFPPFVLNLTSARLQKGRRGIHLQPKEFSLLCYLARNPRRLIPSEELLRAVWPGVIVTPGVLKVRIRRVRLALGDSPDKPRFIETVHGRGYRFIGQVNSQHSVVGREEEKQKAKIFYSQDSGLRTQDSVLVSRDAELAQLNEWLAKATNGERQLVFVTGEPGIGKTTLVDAFLQNLGSAGQSKGEKQKAKSKTSPHPQSPLPDAWIARGQCVEHYGTGEPYRPVLEALGRLCRGSAGNRLIKCLRQNAPTWLAQMPAVLSTTELQALQLRMLGASCERMLRELAEALEILTVKQTLILVLEDLHWADVSTLELLAALARRRESARLLVIGTYRPTEVMEDNHPLKSIVRELYAHQLGIELALGLLSEEDVAVYLRRRFPHSVFPSRLARVLYNRTEGNPLFLVSVVGDLLAQSVLEQVDGAYMFQSDLESRTTKVPESIRHLVARQREQLTSEDRQVLEAASVAGLEFSTASVEAALATDITRIEERCASLAERQKFLRPAGIVEWPDETVAARYGFIHALYQHLWHERVSIKKRQQWHLRIGERKEAAYGNRAREIATELAVHFEQGRDYRRAIHHLQQAGENALRRSANQEAIAHLTRGLTLSQTLPDTLERTRQELGLQVALAIPLTATKGLGAAEVGHIHNRARALCQQIGETPELFPVLWGLCAFYVTRAEWQTALRLGKQLLRLAQGAQDPALFLRAHLALGALMLCRGEFVSARAHLERVTSYNPQHYRTQAFLYGVDPEVSCRSYIAHTLWFLGYPEQALRSSREALTLAQELRQPLSLGFALSITAYLHWYRQEKYLTHKRAKEAMRLATEHELAEVLAWATTVWGWAQTDKTEGVLQIRQGLTACRFIGVELAQPSGFAMLAEAHGRMGQTEEGLKVLAEALVQVDRTGERTYEAELWRLKGVLTLQSKANLNQVSSNSPVSRNTSAVTDPQGEAEACFFKAIKIARQQQAKSFELRATMSLVRLRQQQATQPGSRNANRATRSKLVEARQMLSEVYHWFTEGFDTKDLRKAKTLLEALSH